MLETTKKNPPSMEGAGSPSSSYSQPQASERFRGSDMEVARAPSLHDDGSNIWDWGDLLDFTVDDADLAINWASNPARQQSQTSGVEEQQHQLLVPPTTTSTAEEEEEGHNSDPGRVRKRDPRMVCSNFLAGLVPCACPEMDEKLMEMEEEEAGHGKKRARTVRASSGVARCQVPDCGVDIKELKGYHRRHRVCLRCANATTVTIDGETKRYCQQCGKFHVLADFDEGKRSCRRKLEKHNNRRRRKPAGSKGANEKESQGDIPSEDVSGGDGEAGKDCSQFSSQRIQTETFVESEDGHISPLRSGPDSKDANSDGFLSLVDSGENQMEGGKDNSKRGVSPSYWDNKSTYSSMCPTGRISFKLYDWNPAEFPRRLRHQIFQWLSNMPVELEGYIRPGCIILTVFVAMPRFMWMKLLEDPKSYVHNFVATPGGMLSGRGNILVYLNNMMFYVVKDGTSVIKAKVDVQAPKLHYVHPTCFEAGKPMEFVACGSNLLLPKLRFLLSFSGKYLACAYSPASSHSVTDGNTTSSFDHQLYRIQVPRTEANCFGPVFIEVENEAGLSNFIPLLIGDKETCSEMNVIQQRHNESHFSERPYLTSVGSPSNLCEVSCQRHAAFSEIMLEIAWLLKKPGSENSQPIVTTSQIQRLNYLLNFLISMESFTILEKVVQNLRTVVNKMESNASCNGINEADLKLLQKYMDYAHQLPSQKPQEAANLDVNSRNSMLQVDHGSQSCSQNDPCSIGSFPGQDMEIMVNGKSGFMEDSTYNKRIETISLLDRETILKANRKKEWPSDSVCRVSYGQVLSSRRRVILGFRPTLLVIATAAVCVGICSVLFHPQKVSEFAISIRRCLLNKL
ncbi:squamosa promoter-binding-like protein 7 [Cannabis sativa]|uniref:squamosa promoter-binding-like protein 7 n=1 Tax=Cannabis sativa TaxID=3483 RepID=UPI0029CA73E6|nr:squamosa promoter-binding-like protein 7 [Cannabis sativa]